MTATTTIEALETHLGELASDRRRCIVALAGAPGSGKSTLATHLVSRIEADHPGRAAILPMDGFHYDDLYLSPRGLLSRKGAPETFDVDGLAATMDRLSRSPARPVAVPVFDRTLEIARAGARVIPAEARLVLVEGNYLLLDRPGWDALPGRFDLTIRIDVSEDVLRARLLQRWANLPQGTAERKVEDNDLPNARLVATESVAPDFVLDTAAAG